MAGGTLYTLKYILLISSLLHFFAYYIVKHKMLQVHLNLLIFLPEYKKAYIRYTLPS